MSSNVVVTIGGRLALPLRALPYMTAWAESPDTLVCALALEPTLRVGGKIQEMAGKRVDIVNRNAFCAYRTMSDGSWAVIPSSQWQSVAIELACLTAQMKTNERPGSDGENHARWRVAATKTLPDDVFVWLDEFEVWFAHTRPLAVPSEADLDLWRIEQAKLYADEDLAMILQGGMCEFSRLGKIDFNVVLPAELVGKTWRHDAAAPGQEKAQPPSVKPRIGRPRSQDQKAATLGAIMTQFVTVGAVGLDPMKLAGSLANLLDACQRIEKAKVGTIKLFAIKEDSFRAWLTQAGYGFAEGRTLKSEATYWTHLAPEIAGKTPAGIFT